MSRSKLVSGVVAVSASMSASSRQQPIAASTKPARVMTRVWKGVRLLVSHLSSLAAGRPYEPGKPGTKE